MAKFDKEKLLQISENFIFDHWQGMVEILRLYGKWKKGKYSSLSNLITERNMFLKMLNFPSLESNLISTVGKYRKM